MRDKRFLEVRLFFNLRQYRTLFHHGLRCALTGRGGLDGASTSDGSHHLMGAAYGLSLSTIISCILLEKATPGQFLFVVLTVSMIFTAIAMMSELANGLFDPNESAILGHLPVTGFTRLASRLSTLCVSLSILTLNLNLVPSIHFCFVSKAGFLACPVYLGCAFCASFTVAAACLVLYMLMTRLLSTFQLESGLLYLNILVSLAIFGLVVNTGRFFQSDALRAIGDGTLPSAFPPSWFAGAALDIFDLPGGGRGFSGVAAGMVAISLFFLFVAALGADRFLGSASHGALNRWARSAPGRLMRQFERFFVSPSELAAFEFSVINLARDRGFRQKAYPIIGFPILLIMFTLFSDQHPLFFICMLHLMNLYLPLVITFLPFTDFPRAGWIFDALPMQGQELFRRGVEKAFIYRISIPLFIVNVAVLCAVWTPMEGVLQALFAIVAGHFLVGRKIGCMKPYPFTCEFRGAFSEQNMTGELFSGIAVLGVVAWIQYRVMPYPFVCLGLISAMSFCHWIRFRTPELQADACKRSST
ncbi:MAG: hypothetical protein ABIK28_20630 [Planctomycetota bacterium]